MDIEGPDRQGGYLWLTGSHSRTRKRVERDDDDANAVENLGKVRDRPNRHVIVRLSVVEAVDGGPAPIRLTSSPPGEAIRAAALVGDLTARLTADPHVGPFVAIPSKDNGLDIEGLVALDDGHVLLGLRGPVLRGWAVVIDVVLIAKAQDPARLTLESYHLSFLDLDGLGVRDLCRAGVDVFVLAGPTDGAH